MFEDDEEDEDEQVGEREAWYDAEIAPALSKLCQACQDKGIPFFTAVELDDPGSAGATFFVGKNPSLLFWMLRAVFYSSDSPGVNVDRLLMALMEKARVEGHESMILNHLGVPRGGKVV